MLFHDLLHISCFYLGIEGGFSFSGNHFNQGYLVTHSHATDMFKLHIQTLAVDGLLNRIPDLIASAGNTAGTQADANFTLYLAPIGVSEFFLLRIPLLAFKTGRGRGTSTLPLTIPLPNYFKEFISFCAMEYGNLICNLWL